MRSGGQKRVLLSFRKPCPWSLVLERGRFLSAHPPGDVQLSPSVTGLALSQLLG